MPTTKNSIHSKPKGRKYSFKTRPGPTGRSEAEIELGWRKNRRRKNPVWPGWPSELTRQDPARPGQKPGCNPLTFIFLLKRRRFDFLKKKLTRATRSKHETRALNRTESKNYGKRYFSLISIYFICHVLDCNLTHHFTIRPR
jgi:hypothetical protein